MVLLLILVLAGIYYFSVSETTDKAEDILDNVASDMRDYTQLYKALLIGVLIVLSIAYWPIAIAALFAYFFFCREEKKK